LVAEAKNLSLRESKGEHVVVSQELIERAQEIAILGITEQKAEPEDLERVSIHELGHALLGYLYCRSSHVEKVTLVGRGKALGYTLSRPLKETQLKTEQELRYEVMMMLAGRAAEEVILGSVSSGAADDLMRANHVVKRMVCDLGMGKETGLRTQPDSMDPGAKLPEVIERDIRNLLNELYTDTKTIISFESQWFSLQNKALLEEKILGHNRLFVTNPPLTVKI
jgi:ATP-dependent Zn protease